MHKKKYPLVLFAGYNGRRQAYAPPAQPAYPAPAPAYPEDKVEKVTVQKQMCCDQKCTQKSSVWYPTKWCKSFRKVCVKSDRCKKYSYQYFDTNKCAEYETKYYTTGECIQVCSTFCLFRKHD